MIAWKILDHFTYTPKHATYCKSCQENYFQILLPQEKQKPKKINKFEADKKIICWKNLKK